MKLTIIGLIGWFGICCLYYHRVAYAELIERRFSDRLPNLVYFMNTSYKVKTLQDAKKFCNENNGKLITNFDDNRIRLNFLELTIDNCVPPLIEATGKLMFNPRNGFVQASALQPVFTLHPRVHQNMHWVNHYEKVYKDAS